MIRAAAASLLALTALVPAATAQASTTPLTCHVSMSNSRPVDYTTVRVNVTTSPGAGVTTVAYYKTVATIKATYNSGSTSISYYISGATPGYTVRVGVLVVDGSRTASCLTRFTPHA